MLFVENNGTIAAMNSVLAATKNSAAIRSIQKGFREKFLIDTADSLKSSLDKASRHRYEFILIDAEMLLTGGSDENDGVKHTLRQFRSFFPEVEIIVLTTHQFIPGAVDAVKAGASNYFTYPIDPTELNYVVESIRREQRLYSELNYLRDRFWRRDSYAVLNTKNQRMQAVFEKVRSVAPMETTVLLMGETGTGKGVLAHLIHKHSTRSEKQFISVHCGAIPETLLESELFGHEKGAFTGADRRKLGKFEIAERGTVFLDEIGTISAPMQIKLLQVLQDRSYQRVGGETSLRADVRIIAATNSDLQRMVETGTFRRDLFYRLNVFPIEIPPLRGRIEDIPSLAENFLARWNRLSRKKISRIDPDVMKAFQQYPWPGNIRELENLIERAYVLETSSVLSPESFPAELFTPGQVSPAAESDPVLPLARARQQAVAAFEKQYLRRLLTIHAGKINQSAAAAGITPRQLHTLLSRHGLRKEHFKKA